MRMVNFHSRASGDFSMFEEVALSLLHKMGHSGTVPGALLPEDIPEALRRLRAALAHEVALPGSEDEEPAVTLSNRAYPLIKMLEAAEREPCPVMWD